MSASTALTGLICGKTGNRYGGSAGFGDVASAVPATLTEALHEARRHWDTGTGAANGHPSKLQSRGPAEEPAPPRLGSALTARMREKNIEKLHEGLPHTGEASRGTTASSLHEGVANRHSNAPSAHGHHLPTADELAEVVAGSGPDAEHARQKMRRSFAGTAIALLLGHKLPFVKKLHEEQHEETLPPNIMRIINHHRSVGAKRHEALMAEGLAPAAEAPEAPETSHRRGSRVRSRSANTQTSRRNKLKGPSVTSKHARGSSSRAASTSPPRMAHERRETASPEIGEHIVQSTPKGCLKTDGRLFGSRSRDALPAVRYSDESTTVGNDSHLGAATQQCSLESDQASPTRTSVMFEDEMSPCVEASPLDSLVEEPSSPKRASATPRENPVLAAWRKKIMGREEAFVNRASVVGLLEASSANDDIGKTLKKLSVRKHYDDIQDEGSQSPKVKEYIVIPGEGKSRNSKMFSRKQTIGVSISFDERSFVKAAKPYSPKALNLLTISKASTQQDIAERVDDLVKVNFTVISWTTQRDNKRHAAQNLANGGLGTVWESLGPPSQTLIFDTEYEHEVCGLILRCMGAKTDPQDVTLLRSSSKDGPWLTARRVFVKAGPKHRDTREHEFLFQSGGHCRYWRLDINQNWGAPDAVSILAPITLLSRPIVIDHTWLAEMVQKNLRTMPADAMFFDESQVLSPEDCEVRKLARRHKIPLDYADRLCAEFRRFATGGMCLTYDEFSKLLHSIVASSATGSAANKMDSHADIPESRVKSLWNEIGVDVSGSVEFEEFIIWFHRTFYSDAESQVSMHSKREANTVAERFYAGLGRERLRKIVERNENAAERADRRRGSSART